MRRPNRNGEEMRSRRQNAEHQRILTMTSMAHGTPPLNADEAIAIDEAAGGASAHTEFAALPASAQPVAALLAARGHAHSVVILPQTGRTSAEAAAALGCDVRHIAKSIVFKRVADDRPVLVIASGTNRVDEAKVAAHVGPIGRADARFVRDASGYAIGGVCPIGHRIEPLTLIDEDLMALTFIWAAAGHPHAVFKLTGEELVGMTRAPVMDVALRAPD
jgi:prolyl-tRNA editing enzyme YbaK/EbsC (Cys-tRNA(Pro) deacylase)